MNKNSWKAYSHDNVGRWHCDDSKERAWIKPADEKAQKISERKKVWENRK